MVWIEGLISGPTDFTVRVYGAPGGQFVVEASADLLNWEPLSTNVVSGAGYVEFRESQSDKYSSRFYRASSGAAPLIPNEQSKGGKATPARLRSPADENF